nr:helicase SWR1-like [Anser cygnoides]
MNLGGFFPPKNRTPPSDWPPPQVLRPFLLRRLKVDVEKQMPKKYEHVLKCRLSKRQRYLYDDFMAQASTKATLASGHFMSVINVLMQLRKVCNHPDLFEPRPIHSPFVTEGICFVTASLVLRALDPEPFKVTRGDARGHGGTRGDMRGHGDTRTQGRRRWARSSWSRLWGVGVLPSDPGPPC